MSGQVRTRAARVRQQQLARWARRVPGYRVAVEHLLPAVRRNATLTDVAWRVFVPQHGAGTLPVPLHGGRHVQGTDAVFLPVIGIVALGLTDEQLTSLVEQVAEEQRRDHSFRPLLVVDRPAFVVARRHGYVIEVLVPRQAWADLPQGSESQRVSWDGYLGRRLAGIIDHYQLWHLARAGANGLEPLDLAVVRALPSRLPRSLNVHGSTQASSAS